MTEVSIGQTLIADAIYCGLQNTIQMYCSTSKSGSQRGRSLIFYGI
ncbi:MAG: pyridoxine 5'-phosphate synthase [Chitinophagales bacterium]|nr:pyridoxine 5'-phosphate synthase [Chitinophagales bacterium]